LSSAAVLRQRRFNHSNVRRSIGRSCWSIPLYRASPRPCSSPVAFESGFSQEKRRRPERRISV